jgi:predicted neutral ceramidase superfamily lipid hydrolase
LTTRLSLDYSEEYSTSSVLSHRLISNKCELTVYSAFVLSIKCKHQNFFEREYRRRYFLKLVINSIIQFIFRSLCNLNPTCPPLHLFSSFFFLRTLLMVSVDEISLPSSCLSTDVNQIVCFDFSFFFFSRIIMSDENLLITSTSSNKRSLTEHFVDYVKKSKCLFPQDNSFKRGRFDSFEEKKKIHISFL